MIRNHRTAPRRRRGTAASTHVPPIGAPLHIELGHICRWASGDHPGTWSPATAYGKGYRVTPDMGFVGPPACSVSTRLWMWAWLSSVLLMGIVQCNLGAWGTVLPMPGESVWWDAGMVSKEKSTFPRGGDAGSSMAMPQGCSSRKLAILSCQPSIQSSLTPR